MNYSYKLSAIFQLLNYENTIGVNRKLAHRIGLNEAVVYASLIGKYSYYLNAGTIDSDGYFYSTIADLEESTALGRRAQERAIKRLIELKLIETNIKGSPPKRYFKILDDVEVLENLLTEEKEGNIEKSRLENQGENQANFNMDEKDISISTKRTNQYVQKGQIEMDEKDKLISTKESNQNGRKGHVDMDETYNKTIDNKTIDNKTINNQIISSSSLSLFSQYKKIEKQFKQQILYESLCSDCGNSKVQREQLDEIVLIAIDVLTCEQGYIRVNKQDKPVQVVQAIYWRLNMEHIKYVMDSLQSWKEKAKNIRAVMITSLYNAVLTFSNHQENAKNVKRKEETEMTPPKKIEPSSNHPNRFHNFEQRSYDYNKLEAAFLKKAYLGKNLALKGTQEEEKINEQKE